ncbi:MAG: hypothetical protein JXR95_13290 [Deltaproteobacteria bacterium]|nr:hypothetical protein [Deltaproteobacteria bacterium]
MTTLIVFGMISIPSFMYWYQKSQYSKVIPMGVGLTLLFAVFYASYKFRTLYNVEEIFDFADLTTGVSTWVEKQLVRLGFRPDAEGRVFSAGFRADYYMAPDIKVSYLSDNQVKISGPCFYIRKLRRRFRRLHKIEKKKKSVI